MENIVFFNKWFEQLDMHVQKINLNTKINWKWIIDLNVKWKSIKILEDNIEENLKDLRYGDNFLDITSKSWSMKEKLITGFI